MDLPDSLAALERTLLRVGASVTAHLRPGLTPTTVVRQLSRIGLTPSEEVIAWFEWHNGAADPNAALRDCELAPGVYVYDLDALCQEYLDTRRNFDEVVESLPAGVMAASDLWSPSWFPLARLDAGYIAVDLAAAPTSTSPVHAAWFDADPVYKEQPQWPTTDAFVRDLIRRYDDGTYAVDPDGRVLGPDVDAGLREQP